MSIASEMNTDQHSLTQPDPTQHDPWMDQPVPSLYRLYVQSSNEEQIVDAMKHRAIEM